MESIVLSPANEDVDFIDVFDDSNEHKIRKVHLPEQLPVLVLRNSVLLPGVLTPINISREKSVKLARAAFAADKNVAVVMQRNTEQEDPQFEDLHRIGSAAQIVRMLELPDSSVTVILQGTQRIELQQLLTDEPYFIAAVKPLEDIIPDASNTDYKLVIDSVRSVALEVIKLSPHLAPEAGFAVKNIGNRQFLVNYLAVNTEVSGEEKQKLVEIGNLEHRAKALLEVLMREQKALELKWELQQKVSEGIHQQTREYFLQAQMREIQKELGAGSTEQEAQRFREKMKAKKWGEAVAATFERELGKLEKMHPASGEYPIQLNYLQTLIDLPWNEFSEDKLDLDAAQQVLDEDHYGLEEAKERMIEHLAVIKLKGNLKSPIMCLYGPPGVGKTSLGKSVARALGREFGRISLGGLHDEAEIRGHRKTYIGAMPGRIMQTIRRCKTSNPVVILDEIDKVGSDFRGDPSSALLEVLDPEQNATFYDNFLELEYDLSHVLFITTANNIATIHPALRDRMEMLEVSGYTQEEKLEIVKRHLLPRLLNDHGITPEQLQIPDELVVEMIVNYTRESGVRGIEKQLAKIIRHTARLIASGKTYAAQLTPDALRETLGAPKFTRDKALEIAFTGVATGLAWTANGGEILFVEASISKGKGAITTTGQLGDVMKESAVIALEYVRACADALQIDAKMFTSHNLHIHVPEGAIPKDGPSAGITMVTAIASVFAGRKVRKGLAMTGEATLRGKVLPVGGIKEKMLAAKRAGISDIVLPADNRKDVDEIKPGYLTGLTFRYVDDIKDVLEIALE
ncbi:MAG: endopeptidase La [Prevotellaceae bacterium]|jgi:ATP-dependent Lon protease|nr:endopeptidase La [Prevotellaceae bacterium]